MGKILSIVLMCLLAYPLYGQNTGTTVISTNGQSKAGKKMSERFRVLVSTDIGGTDPDDNQSMAHLLMYSNEFDLEGLISSPSFGSGSTSEIYRMIDVYEKDLPKLRRHVKGLMKPKTLRKLVKLC